MKNKALLAFGANLGNPGTTFQNVVEQLQKLPDLDVTATSQLIPTTPVGGRPNQPDFLNGAICIDTSLDAATLITRLLEVEVQLGRTRDQRWDARTVDLDLLLLDQQVITNQHCQIPHPRMSFRQFMLIPAAEVATNWIHPFCGCSLGNLLSQIRRGIKRVTIVEQGPEKSCEANAVKIDCLKRICRNHHLPLVEPGESFEPTDGGQLTILLNPASIDYPTRTPYLELCGSWSDAEIEIELEAAFLAAEPINDCR